jgi:hypothetical protein
MKIYFYFQLFLLFISIGIMEEGQAALLNRGGGLIYDDVLDITWQQNANLAATTDFGVEGIDANGYMNWQTAQTWIQAMNNENYLGYNDWRLPITAGILNPFGVFGPIDCLYVTEEVARGNEMGYLFYYTLNGQKDQNLTGSQGPFIDIKGVYWFGTENPLFTDSAYGFIFGGGYNQQYAKSTIFNSAWAVRDGDSASVPEPGTAVLLGLGCLLIRKRRK